MSRLEMLFKEYYQYKLGYFVIENSYKLFNNAKCEHWVQMLSHNGMFFPIDSKEASSQSRKEPKYCSLSVIV